MKKVSKVSKSRVESSALILLQTGFFFGKHGSRENLRPDDSMSMNRRPIMAKIAFEGKAEAARTLQRAIANAAARAGLSDYRATVATERLFDLIESEVINGRVVSWPALGLFAPVSTRDDSNARCSLRFVAARPLAFEVRASCPPERAQPLPERSSSNKPNRIPVTPLMPDGRRMPKRDMRAEILALIEENGEI